MANLFWKINDKTKSMLSKSFESEEKFEKMIFETPEILEDIFLIKRQIRGMRSYDEKLKRYTLMGVFVISIMISLFLVFPPLLHISLFIGIVIPFYYLFIKDRK